MIDVEEKKRKILEVIKEKGPSLPVHISREIGLNSLFTSAILSEMVSNKTIKISNLKVGGSPLYYLAGQEKMLENFSKHLGFKGRETFELLKRENVLQDDAVSPADRISLREIKDFAFHFRMHSEEGEKLFWRFHTLNQDDAIAKVAEINKKRRKEKKVQKEKLKGEKKEQKPEIKKEKIDKGIIEIKKEVEIEPKEKHLEIKKEIIGKEITEIGEFFGRIDKYLQENKIFIVQTNLKKKKEINLIVHVPSNIGKIEMFLIGKDKKSISDADLSIAASQSNSLKLPILFLSTGKLTKNAENILENFKNHVFFRQV